MRDSSSQCYERHAIGENHKSTQMQRAIIFLRYAEIVDQSNPTTPTPSPRRREPICWAITDWGEIQHSQEIDVSMGKR